MRVVLLSNIKGIGQVGDIKDVNDGYARNFLLPRGLAKAATTASVSELTALKAKKLQLLDLAHQESKELAARLAGTRIELKGKANEKGTLFAGIEAKKVASTLSDVAGIRITPEAILLEEQLKTTGDHPVTIQLAEGLTTQIVVAISPE